MTRSRLLDGLRALLAAAVLTALIAGVPLALHALAGSPLPAHLPDLGKLAHTLTHRDDGTLFLTVVKDLSWAAWAGFVVSTLVELTSRVGGRAAPHLPGLGAAQWLAAQLISSIALAAGSPAAFVMAAVPPAAVVATASAALADTTPAAAADTTREATRLTGTVPHPAAHPATAHSPAGGAPTATGHIPSRLVRLTHATYQVRRGDCLWTIAERHLGDGDRYTEIADLNIGRVMTDGAHFTHPDVIRPGWVLRMPAAATDLDRSQPPISDRHAGHPSDAPDFSRPHDGAPSSPQPPASQEFSKEGDRSAAAPDAAPPALAEPRSQARASAPESTTILLTDAGTAQDKGPGAPVAAFAGGVAVGSLITLARLRHAQRQARRRGRRIPLPTDPATLRTEQELHRLAALDALARRALTQLGDVIAAAGRELPPVLGVRVSEGTVELLLAQPAGTPPAPFSQGRTKATWRTDLQGAAQADKLREVLPGLLTTGYLDDGHALLVNLERLQAATASGPADLVDRFLVTAAAELLTGDGPWFDVLAVGFPELHAAGSRVRACTDLTEALGLLADRARDLRGRLATTDGPADVADRRLRDPDGDWTLTVLISRQTPSPEQLTRLTDTVTALPGGLAALVPGDEAGAPARFELSEDDQGPLLNVTPPGLAVRPHLMSMETYQRLGDLFSVAAGIGDVAADAPPYDTHAGENLLPLASSAPAPAEPGNSPHEEARDDPGQRAEEDAEPETRRETALDTVQVSILGPLEITGTAADLQPKMAELVLALTLAGPTGLRNVQLAAMMGPDPDTPKPSDQLRQLITRTRGKLGKAPDGQTRIHCDSAYVYRTHAVTLDWTRFQELADRGAKRNRTEDLWDALALVRGPVLDGCYHWWLETPLIENIRAEIVDAADLLAELELDAGRPDRSARAARQGLASDPYAEQLWRALMRAEYEAGNISHVHEAWKACLKAVAEVSADGDPHPETTALYRRLTARRSA
ncbi:BTAD domain-containing putative transcriptional regulator [Microbispora sp. H10885]|uniref:BTAD domain-containing putative transcriptional regulator n=1 Tax=Microbispora sp. H10885 TaxID=2729110 RepID=UPI00160121B5|nr:BTAD domain-containing putative transcriptional regulator [Microbispora sp. H10885]